MDQEKAAPDKKLQTLLLVDDEQIVIEPTCLLLEGYGYSVLTANSGEQAIDILENERQNIDVVILDMLMPDMNGKETYQHVRNIRQDSPVLIASGYHTSDEIDYVMKNGCRGCIQKPYRVSDLHEEIQNCLT